MGQLKPGTTYVYERANGVVYAREFGADPQDRFVIGYESKQAYDMAQDLIDNYLWTDIRRAARTNPALQDAMERVIIIYGLSKKNE